MKERGWGELYHSLVIGICLEIRISDLGFFKNFISDLNNVIIVVYLCQSSLI